MQGHGAALLHAARRERRKRQPLHPILAAMAGGRHGECGGSGGGVRLRLPVGSQGGKWLGLGVQGVGEAYIAHRMNLDHRLADQTAGDSGINRLMLLGCIVMG